MDFRLPTDYRKATFRRLYGETELYRSLLQTYTKPLFSWRKALSASHDNRTLYDFARRRPREARVLAFHSRRGSTSPLYEELREKYPDR